MSWNDLSMADRAMYIKLGVDNGIINLSDIREVYNKYDEGGHKFRLIGEHSGTNYGEFSGKEEALEAMREQGREQVFRETLPELVVEAKKPRSLLEQGAANFEETFGISPRDAAGFVPILGDALDIKDIGDNVKEGNYTEAGIGTAMLLLPNFIEKPLKYAKRGIDELLSYGNDFFVHPTKTYKAIKEKRYTPLMSKKDKKEFLRNLRYKIQTEVRPFTREVATNNVRVRNSNSTGILELEPDIIEFSNPYPTIEFRNYIRNKLGSYSPSKNTIQLRTRDSFFGRHRYRDVNDVLGTAAHEYGHFWSQMYPSVRSLTIPTRKYYGPNKSHSDINIFSPIFKYKPGKWKSSPDEVIAEIFKHKWNIRNSNIVTIDSPQLFDISFPIAKRFNINKRDASQMVVDMGEKGYKYGGQLK